MHLIAYSDFYVYVFDGYVFYVCVREYLHILSPSQKQCFYDHLTDIHKSACKCVLHRIIGNSIESAVGDCYWRTVQHTRRHNWLEMKRNSTAPAYLHRAQQPLTQMIYAYLSLLAMTQATQL